MTIVCIEFKMPGNIDAIDSWLKNNQSITIKFITFTGNYCYIFYE